MGDQMVDSIIEGLDQYFRKCPLLKDGVFRVDTMGPEPIEYELETGMTTPVIRTYLDGSSVRQYMFNFNSREYFSMDRFQMIQNSTFCNWVEEQNFLENFPEMPEGCEAQALTVLTPGFMLDATMINARYQVQLQLQYFKEALKKE